jgi:predicted enzyme related to lactoylglutathione lyase
MDASAFLGDQPGRWQFYLQVADVDETVAKAVSIGGELERPAEDTPYGRMATLMDPGGLGFSVLDPRRRSS